jgi:hypothetical protein
MQHKTNEIHIFQINAFIRFLTSSTCFETHQDEICTRSFCIVCFSRWAAYINALKTCHTTTACKMRLPDDEPMSIETCRRR